jgi:hypothetical protein
MNDLISAGEECSLCLMPFSEDAVLEHSRLRIIRSQIEYVNQLADNEDTEYVDEPGNY